MRLGRQRPSVSRCVEAPPIVERTREYPDDTRASETTCCPPEAITATVQMRVTAMMVR